MGRHELEELHFCDHMPNLTAEVSTADESYAVWRSLSGLWPPTKSCVDDQEALDRMVSFVAPHLVGSNCTAALTGIAKISPNFDCDNSDTTPTFRHICCSACGGHAIPDVPTPAPTPEAPVYTCHVCDHVYDPQKDGNGKPFEELPDSWKCPVCGAPKSAYSKTASGEWVHNDEAPAEKTPVYTCSVCQHVYDPQKDGNGKPFEDLPDSWKCPICGQPKSAYKKTASGEWVHNDEAPAQKTPKDGNGKPFEDLSDTWTCSVCQHVYDPQKDGNGKPFEDLPDSWKCPVCGSPKSAFKKTTSGKWVHTDEEFVI